MAFPKTPIIAALTSNCAILHRFCVYLRGEQLGQAVLNVPGQHNVHNALGVIALASELGFRLRKCSLSSQI
jgi:UDP-N-acetylmuramate-alanine ligase